MWKKKLAISCIEYVSYYLIIFGIIGTIAAFISKPISMGGVVGGIIITVLGFLCMERED